MQKLTNGKGVEHIVEVVGGSSIAKSIDALASQGHIYVIDFLKIWKQMLIYSHYLLNKQESFVKIIL